MTVSVCKTRLMGILDRLLRRPPMLHVAGDVGEGPVVVMIHGIASSSVTFDPVVPLLRDRHRCITIDLLGFGGSPKPENATYSLDEHAAALHRTISSLRLSAPFTLVGHSLGSLVAARYASTHRSRVGRLVLVSAPIYLPPELFGDPRDRATMGFYYAAYEFLRANPEFTLRTAAALAALVPVKHLFEITQESWHPFRLSLKNAIESQTTLADLSRVRGQVELVYGRLDPFLASGGLAIVEQLRNVDVHRVPAEAHLIRSRLARAVAAAVDHGDAETVRRAADGD